MESTLVIIAGLVIGSFLNVVIYRLGTGVSLKGRSGCMSCGAKLRSYDMIPVLSFLFLRGKCRACQSRISWQYPAVELATALSFFVAYYFFGLTVSFAFTAILASVIVVIVAYDIKHMMIPDEMIMLLVALAGITLFTTIPEIDVFKFVLPAWSAIFAGPIVALPFFILWLVSKGRWIGFGDVKLALPIGWLLGISSGFLSLVFAFWIGLIILILYGIVSLLVHKKFSFSKLKKKEIPLGPFLCLSLFLVFVTGITFADCMLWFMRIF